MKTKLVLVGLLAVACMIIALQRQTIWMDIDELHEAYRRLDRLQAGCTWKNVVGPDLFYSDGGTCRHVFPSDAQASNDWMAAETWPWVECR